MTTKRPRQGEKKTRNFMLWEKLNNYLVLNFICLNQSEKMCVLEMFDIRLTFLCLLILFMLFMCFVLLFFSSFTCFEFVVFCKIGFVICFVFLSGVLDSS